MAASQRLCSMKHFVVMGVSSCGKSTIARALTERLAVSGQNATMIEADDLHGAANIDKMKRGEALTDKDRYPWLLRVGQAIKASNATAVVSCSALRRDYRQCLIDQTEARIGFIHLHADRDVILKRMADRQGHFMPLSLLQSQLQTLEPLAADEFGITVDISQSIDAVVNDALVFVQKVAIEESFSIKPTHS